MRNATPLATTITGSHLPRFWRDILNSFQASIDGLKQRFERTTPRERILLAILIMGAALYAPVHALERLNLSSEAYVEALSDQSSARMAAQMARRVAASAADTAALEDMKTWAFQASNAPVAQVMIEQKLVATADRLALPNPRISTQSKVESEGPTNWMFAEVQMDLRWGPAFAFIDSLGTWPEGFRLTGFRYEVLPFNGVLRPGDPIPTESGTIRLNLAFPVVLDQMPEAAGNSLSNAARVAP